MQRHHRLEPVLPAGREHPAIVLQLRERKLTFFGFDARPFDREAVGIEAERREQCHIIRVAMIVVAGVSGGFGIDSAVEMLEQPRIAVYITTLNLMRRRRRAPKKPARKFHVVASSQAPLYQAIA